MEDNSNEILTLLAKDELAAHMFNEPHNKDRYHPPEWRFDFTRESTPSCAGDEETHSTSSSLKLTFDKMPKHAELGYTFGRDPRKCDIYLPKQDISGVHFHVTFSPEGRLLLVDTSSAGMWLSFNGQRNFTPRHKFTWILDPDIKTIEADFGNDHSPRFQLKVPRHTNIQAYRRNVAMFQKSSGDAGPAVSSLFLSSHPATAQDSRTMSPRRRPWYLKEDIIGRGQFGVVSKARDISTNKLYAIKEVLPPLEDTAKRWQKEIEIMKSLPYHPHIVRFVDSCDEGCLQIVMEYMPRGNLTDEQKRRGMAVEECMLLLRQGLQALVHIHSHGYTHRDVKPDNVLVKSRTPFHIMLADFGLSQSNSILFTFCGTSRYLAPEITRSQKWKYTPVVDVWALGVVVFESAYGLPNNHKTNKPWAKIVIDTANDFDSDRLVDLLCTGMLVEDYRERLPAETCLEQASQIPVESLRLQSSLHQANNHDPSTLLSSSLQGTVKCGIENKLEAPKRLKDTPPTVINPSSLSATNSSRQYIAPIGSITKPRHYDSIIPTVIIKSDYLQMEAHGKMITMRRSDASFNARQLLSLINKSQGQEELLKAFGSIRGFKQEVLKGSDNLWVPFTYGKTFCQSLDFETVLKPLLDYGNGFIVCYYRADVVMIRRAGLLINATHLYKIAKEDPRCMQLKTKDMIMDGPYQGKYCSISEGFKWCRSQRLIPVIKCLRKALKDHGYVQRA